MIEQEDVEIMFKEDSRELLARGYSKESIAEILKRPLSDVEGVLE